MSQESKSLVEPLGDPLTRTLAFFRSSLCLPVRFRFRFSVSPSPTTDIDTTKSRSRVFKGRRGTFCRLHEG